MSRRAHSAAGLTILEILVVMAIFLLLVIGVATGVSRLTKSQLKSSASALAGELRYAFNRAQATATHQRVIINLDEQWFRMEECKSKSGAVTIRRAEDQKDQADQLVALQKKLTDENKTSMDQQFQTAMDSTGKSLPSATAGLEPPTCQPVKSDYGKPQKLPRSRVHIGEVWLAHLDRPAKDGTVEINFFPQGYAEKSVVEVTDGDDTFSVVVHPITGHVDVRSGEWKRPEDFVHTDAQGTAQP